MFEVVHTYLAEFTYVGIFLVLLLCGLGLPLPEDIPILISGYLSHLGILHFGYALAVNMAGIITGDIIIFCLGYFWGQHAIQHRFLRPFITPKRMEKVEIFFDKHGRKAVFFGRFIAGLRAPLFLAAGIIRIPAWRFLCMDGLAALLSVPVLLFLAYYLGDQLDSLRRIVGNTKKFIVLILGAGIAFYAIRLFIRRWKGGPFSAAG